MIDIMDYAGYIVTIVLVIVGFVGGMLFNRDSSKPEKIDDGKDNLITGLIEDTHTQTAGDKATATGLVTSAGTANSTANDLRNKADGLTPAVPKPESVPSTTPIEVNNDKLKNLGF